MAIIETVGVSKTYHLAATLSQFLFARGSRSGQVKTALTDVNLSVEPGTILGIVGANGAGKSTLIKLLCGVLTPTEGTIYVCDLHPERDRIRLMRQISAVFGQRTQLWWDLPVFRSFDMIAAIYRVPHNIARTRLLQLVDRLQLHDLLTKPVRSLSLGQRVRCDIAAGLLHEPALVFLDEPTIGLDHETKHVVREFLKEENQVRGLTIVLSSHDFGDLESLAERIVLIDEGSVRFDGHLGQLVEGVGGNRVAHATFRLPKAVICLDGFSLLCQDGRQASFAFNSANWSDLEVYQHFNSLPSLDDLRIEPIGLRELLLRYEISGGL